MHMTPRLRSMTPVITISVTNAGCENRHVVNCGHRIGGMDAEEEQTIGKIYAMLMAETQIRTNQMNGATEMRKFRPRVADE